MPRRPHDPGDGPAPGVLPLLSVHPVTWATHAAAQSVEPDGGATWGRGGVPSASPHQSITLKVPGWTSPASRTAPATSAGVPGAVVRGLGGGDEYVGGVGDYQEHRISIPAGRLAGAIRRVGPSEPARACRRARTEPSWHRPGSSGPRVQDLGATDEARSAPHPAGSGPCRRPVSGSERSVHADAGRRRPRTPRCQEQPAGVGCDASWISASWAAFSRFTSGLTTLRSYVISPFSSPSTSEIWV